ncbi:GNAT family N-acetyltransferase [Leptodesmis sichuanensis]|uniref:GNAT family N-acetyltransferase n=1 Tax=Leptodesmis sichuanensis TaxID=2906798 RepID=UPI001F1AD52A|nr:GNAT family N-acetyltransferase [Leptodesmis sichuanensis]UIE36350.1 GNAT family N-acetyltransferase [Leptodesmis sichuanensis A121]
MKAPIPLPSGCILRPATQADIWPIRWLVLSVPLDPTQLRWQQFWVIEFEKKMIACGQLRSFEEAQELGSLVVAKGWRDRGVGSILARHLIQEATQPLYLECLGQRLAAYYRRFGFEPVDWEKLPRSLQRKFGTSKTVATLLRLPLVIMHRPD